MLRIMTNRVGEMLLKNLKTDKMKNTIGIKNRIVKKENQGKKVLV